jgi:hypothetical protein
VGTPTRTYYRIIIGTHLDPRWSHWFEGMELTHEPGGTTVMTGALVDQAALHGLLAKIRDLGLPLLALHPAAPDQHSEP